MTPQGADSPPQPALRPSCRGGADGSLNPRGLRRVAAVRFSALGDVAMTVPVLYSACRCYPDVAFTLVTRQSMTSIFINAPENLDVVGVDLQAYTGVRGMWRLAAELWRACREPQAWIDLHDVLRTRLLDAYMQFRGATVSVINKGRRGRRALTRRNNKVLLPLLSSRARYRQAFHRLGLPVESRFDGLFAPRAHGPASAFANVTPPKARGEAWVGIAPFAKHEGKIYPPEMMEQLLVMLLTSHKRLRVFLFGGGPDEDAILRGWAQRHGTPLMPGDPPRVVSLAGLRLGFGVELALESWLDVMVSMDSANMHLASLVAVPVVSVWGATHPYCGFKGWRQREEDIVQLPMTCRPCSVFGNRPCFRGDHHCLRAVTPQMIFEKVNKYLD